MTEPTIVVLGGGAGGVVAANELHSRLKGKAKIIVVERSPKQSFIGRRCSTKFGNSRPRAVGRTRKSALPCRADVENSQTRMRAVYRHQGNASNW